jgi:hypothetical protein
MYQYLTLSTVGAVTLGSAGALLLCILLTALSSALFPRRFDYRGRHVCVTGGSSGIGLEAARAYLKLGANVSILARNTARLIEAKADLERSVANYGSASSGGTGVLHIHIHIHIHLLNLILLCHMSYVINTYKPLFFYAMCY